MPGEAICIADERTDDDMNDDLNEESGEVAAEDGLEESNGVDSDAGGWLSQVLASRLQTGQNVLHVVSQASTQNAWNL